MTGTTPWGCTAGAAPPGFAVALLLAALARQASGGAMCPPSKTVCSGPRTREEFLTQVAGPAVYDKALSPNQACGSSLPVVAEVQFHLVYLDKVDQMYSQIVFGGYLRTWWKDPRLAYNKTANGGCFDDTISMLPNFKPENTFWTPNLYIDNVVKVDQVGANLMEISPDGSIWVSQMVQLQMKANLNFQRLPFDYHTITVVIGSYSLRNSIVRVIPKGGAPGLRLSGKGLTSEKISSATWSVQDGDAEKEGGMTTAGVWETRFKGTWDYTTLQFKISRKPKFFVEQVLIQDGLFLGVSYAGFFVDPKVAPARAAMAVIPVLIMRTLANSVFQGLPQLSYQVWLSDYLMVSMWLCVFCVVQFAITQSLLLYEARCSAYFAKLQATENDMRKIIRVARDKGTSTIKLLDSLTLTDMPDDMVANWNYEGSKDIEAGAQAQGEGERARPQTLSSQEQQISEATVGVLHNAARQFRKFDRDGSGSMAPPEIQRMLLTFNIHMRVADCAEAMCKFLRDHGHLSPKDHMKAALRLGEFLEFLYDLDDYLIAVPHYIKTPFSRSLARSQRLDIAAQWFFPIIVLMKILIFFAVIPAYNPPDP